jgi:hypothetical protein
MKWITKVKKIILLLALPLVLWLFYNHVANWHFHVTQAGIVVEHSHPYKNNPVSGTPFQRHHHTDAELSFYTLLSSILTLLVVALVSAIVLTKTASALHGVYHSSTPGRDYYFIYRLRGPPRSA